MGDLSRITDLVHFHPDEPETPPELTENTPKIPSGFLRLPPETERKDLSYQREKFSLLSSGTPPVIWILPSGGALHLYSEVSHGKHRSQVLRPCSPLRASPSLEHAEIFNITEESRKSRKYVVLEFRDVCVLFRDVFRSVYSVFSVGGNTINDEGEMARDE